MPALDLAGTWTLRDGAGGICVDMAVPGDALSALADAGVIPEPYHGDTVDRLGWVAAREWTLSRSVTLDSPEVDLVVSMLDTVADLRVNGVTVLHAASMFRSFRVDLSGAARAGDNEIEIRFRSAPAEAARRGAVEPFVVPWHRGNCRIAHINMLRKPQCDFGWDWNPALAPFGLYGEVRLDPRRAARLGHVAVTQEHRENSVSVRIEAAVEGGQDGTPLTIGLGGVETVVELADGRAVSEILIGAPQYWWPAGQGEQPLYDLEVRLGDQAVRRRIGLCDIRLLAGGEADGFRLSVNGREVFAKGANWVPADALAGRIDRARVEDLLRSAVAANMNMIRVWGGGRYEPDWFYDLCDALGLMVWQDFMFASNLYPATPAFLAEIAAEVGEQARRLHHHPCIALWCGDNEIIGMLSEFPESRAARDRYLVAYDRLNRTVETALKSVLPGANWWPSSPSLGPLDFGDARHEDGRGDMHVWLVWHGGKDFESCRALSPRFVSEFGFQSFPSMDSIRSFASPGDMNITSPVMEAHQRAPGGTARIAETMTRYFRFPADFGDFVYLSQIQQGLALRLAVEHWRGLRPRCMGVLYWQLNDTWPGISWSTLDHGGGWKLSHHMARRFFAPVIATVTPEEDGMRLRVVNDSPRVARGKLEVAALAPDGTQRALAQPWYEIRGGTAQAVALLEPGALEPHELLLLEWRDPDDRPMREVHAPRRWKTHALQPARVSLDTALVEGGVEITLTAETLALFVALEADRPGRFCDNAITLLPAESRIVIFTPDTPGPVPRFTLRELHGATHGTAQ